MRDKNYCIDCEIDTYENEEDYYMLTSEVWDSITNETEREGMLCWNCMEQRLGRKIENDDLRMCPLSIINPNSRVLLYQKQIKQIIHELAELFENIENNNEI